MKFVQEGAYFYVDIPRIDKKKAEAVGGEWNRPKSMYRFPFSIYAMREVMRAFPLLKNDEKFVEMGQRIVERQKKMLALRQAQDAPGDVRLRPYQRADVAYLSQLPSAGIFNQQRTGKTPTALVTAETKGLKKVVIVCPASLILNWKEEVEKWTGKNSTVLTGSKQMKEKSLSKYTEGYLIVSYETLRNSKESICKIAFDGIIVDEAHRLRNHKSQQSQAVYSLTGKHRYALTGTPTVKNGYEIYGILRFLYPDRFPSYWVFVNRYFEVTTNPFGGKEIGGYIKHREQELKELIGIISTNRKRADVMKWLPAKQYHTIPLTMGSKQKKAYTEMVNLFVTATRTGELDAPSLLAQFTRLRQLCLDPEIVDIEAGSAKTEALLEMIAENPLDPVIVMSSFTSYLKRLASILRKQGFSVGLITGEESVNAKQRTAKEFQEGRLGVLLCNIKSAGTGFTLDRAENIIFTDKEWNPADNEQAEDRIVPVSQERNHSMQVTTLVVKDTVDERIEELLKHKKSVTDVINSGSVEAILNLLQG